MKSISKILILSCLCVTSAFADSLPSTLLIEEAYVRGLPPSVKNTSAYMTITNTSDTSMVLTGAKSDIAESVMVHRTESNEGMMSMHHMMSAEIPAHGQLVLETGGVHLMIMGLKSPVSPGDIIEITLSFDDGAEQAVSMPVKSVLDE
jgi:periplasmic copper chaperone A